MLANHLHACWKLSISVREAATCQCFVEAVTAQFCPADSVHGGQLEAAHWSPVQCLNAGG